MSCCHLLAIYISLLMSQLVTPIIATTSIISLRLIHRNSVLSPFYDKNLDISDLVSHSIKTSKSRHDYIKAKMTNFNANPHEKARASLYPNDSGVVFMVNVSIGEPLVSQLLTMDTGSSLTWIQCHPCVKCIEGSINPIFEPRRSSTYSALSCSSYPCTSSYNTRCAKQTCLYNAEYTDNSSSVGTLSIEKFTFFTSNGEMVKIPDVVFGCGFDNHEYVSKLSGVFGLQSLGHSILSSIGQRFSYCIGNVRDPHYKYNQLILGDGAIIEGDSTRLRIHNGFYIVFLEDISIGDKKLSIKNKSQNLELIIDSGSTLTYLQKNWFQPLKEEIHNLISGFLKPLNYYETSEHRLCYAGNFEQDLKGFPIVTLHLSDDCMLELDVDHMFHKVRDDMFCTAVAESNEGLNIIGILAQQYYNVGYDLDAMTVSFQSIECELLEED